MKSDLVLQVLKGYRRIFKNRRFLAIARLINIQRERAIGMLNAGMSKIAVARAFHCTRATINSLWNRLQQTGSTADRPRPGIARVTTPARDRRYTLVPLT